MILYSMDSYTYEKLQIFMVKFNFLNIYPFIHTHTHLIVVPDPLSHKFWSFPLAILGSHTLYPITNNSET